LMAGMQLCVMDAGQQQLQPQAGLCRSALRQGAG
jgi:hypothetical protein